MEGRQIPPLVGLVGGETVVGLVGGVDLGLPVAGRKRIEGRVQHRRIVGPILKTTSPVQEPSIDSRADPHPAHATIIP